MGAIASQITSITIVCSTVYIDANQRKHQSFASLAFVRGIHWGPVNSPYKWPAMRKMFPLNDVIMKRPAVWPAATARSAKQNHFNSTQCVRFWQHVGATTAIFSSPNFSVIQVRDWNWITETAPVQVPTLLSGGYPTNTPPELSAITSRP